MTDSATALAKLREPFPDHHISKLPKESKAQADQRKADRSAGVNCKVCGGWHHKSAVHLDYVGHAALTDRLLDADPTWTWEPMAFTTDGLPALDRTGGLWIKLTVAGVTRLGYGAADGKSGGDAVKEIIGDALRNAAMRFGAALDLWHKGDLHLDDDPQPASAALQSAPQHDPVDTITDDQRDQIVQLANAAGMTLLDICKSYKIGSLKALPASKSAALVKRLGDMVKSRQPAGAPARDALALDDEIPY